MSSLIKSAKIVKSCLKPHAAIFTAVRHHWNKDYKPGPYPKTEAERLKAAQKYGLHPSEYTPYPDDGDGWGDYPKLPLESVDSKDPYYPYDSPELKRNFNEVLHDEFDLIRDDRYDVSARLKWPMWVYWGQFLGCMLGFAVVYWACDQVKMFHPVKPKQYPQEGKVYYTFETE